MQERKIIIEHSTVNLAFQVEKLIHEGWKIDERHPFQSIGLHYECGLIFVGKQEELVADTTPAVEFMARELPISTSDETPSNSEIKQEEAPKAPTRQAGRPKSK